MDHLPTPSPSPRETSPPQLPLSSFWRTPPRSATLEAIAKEGQRHQLPAPSWGTGPSGTCVIWAVPADAHPPSTFTSGNHAYKLSRFRSLPAGYSFTTLDDEVDALLRDCFAAPCDELPEELSSVLIRLAEHQAETKSAPETQCGPDKPASPTSGPASHAPPNPHPSPAPPPPATSPTAAPTS